MKITTKQILNILLVLSWIIFVGICIQAGGFIVSTSTRLFLDPAQADRFWQQVDLSALYNASPSYFIIISIQMIIVAVLKAILFYLIIDVLQQNKLNLTQPFNKEIGRFISIISYLSLAIGLFSFFGTRNTDAMVMQGIKMPDVRNLELAGADVWLFMAVTLFVISQIYKRGIEIQEEHELTV